MLSNDTRKIIDDARDTLVGQIPVPMMQCQQITLALTYKFMSDDDQRAERLGGERHYFAGDLEPYGWDKIMSLRLDDTQRSELYRAGLGALQESDSMPAVFREIFKDAVVPFGDHRTLALFLSTMDRMVYDDSEKLGDAYEYLLKTAEAQADAGQFRTPRHIIDFIVKIINPQKHEVIIDPACGTAGFLVSAYQHVKSQHDLQGGGSSLSVPDFTRLADNLKGYDISPEMTKLAMANMYLHTQDKNPNIDNYDTLTSTDHWNEYADVMLANPPFMTPRGGIRPHSRFRVPAKRAEVLFVDYMASHLNEHGRAGIIVPEGIIFQSQNVYRQLRRLLLDESLVAVISLPGGVFNPYSGVKTSILILDKVLAPKTDCVAFFKVENDGYDLGAQRRPIGKDDLPAVASEIDEFLRRLRGDENLDGFVPQTGLVVDKQRIAASDDFDLSGEKYRGITVRETNWPTVELGEVVEIFNGITSKKSDYRDIGSVKVIKVKDFDEFGVYFDKDARGWIEHEVVTSKYLRMGDSLMINAAHNASHVASKIGYLDRQPPFKSLPSGEVTVFRPTERVLPVFLNKVISSRSVRSQLKEVIKGIHIYPKDIQRIEIPLPPLEVQRELVAEIETYQRVVDGARAVVDNWRPHVVVDPEWSVVQVGDCCAVKGGKRLPKGEQLSTVWTDYPYIRVSDFADQTIDSTNLKFVPVDVQGRIARYTISASDVYISIAGTIGLMGTIPDELDGANLTENAARLSFDQSILDKHFLAAVGNGEMVQRQIRALTHAVGVPKLALERIKTIKIPLPPIGTQQAIVAEIEAEQALVSANRELVERMEQRIQDAIMRVWQG